MGLSTHTGRSTAITVLYTEEGVDLADIARHVGHAIPTTTAGYVRHLGSRPLTTTQAASRLLDPTLSLAPEMGVGSMGTARPSEHCLETGVVIPM